MSVYDDRRSRRTREPEYIETEDTYISRGAPRDLVLRPRRDEYDDYEQDYRSSRRDDYGARSRSHGLRRGDSYYEDDYYSDYDSRDRRGRRQYDDYDDYDERPAPRERRKSTVEKALDGLGLAGVVGAVTGKSRSRSRRRQSDDRSRYSGSRSRSRGADNRKKWQQAAKAAVITGIIEGVRSRNEPGGWTGAKGQRVATAALGAAGIDGFLDRHPDEKSKRHIVESVVGGLAANRIANGKRESSTTRGRSQSRGGRSRSRSVVDRLRSRSRSVFGRRDPDDDSSSRGRSASRGPGLKEAAGVAGVAAIGKAIYDRVRSKSRGRLGRSRSRSVGSEDSYVPSRRPRYAQQRSRGGPSDRDRDENYDDRQVSRGRPAEQRNAGGEGNNDDRDRSRGKRSSSSSSVSTTDLENMRKKTRGKELLTAGLATVATIHAGHGVYQSMVASEKRHKMVMEGEISPEEARKRKSKNVLQDVAAVGIAALGIKSAFGEWKEMNEHRREKHECEARRRRHRKARDRRQKEQERNMRMGGAVQPYGGGGGYPAGPGYGNGAVGYADSNPYGAYNNLPPPPVGGR